MNTEPRDGIGPKVSGRLIPYVREHGRWILVGLACLAAADGLALVPPWIIKEAIDSLTRIKGGTQLLGFAGAILGAALLQAVFRYGWRTALFSVARHVEYGLRNELFGTLQRLDRAFFLQRSTGDLMSRCTNDLVAVQELIAFVGLLIVDSSLTIITCVVLMLVIDSGLTLVALLPLPLLSLCFMYFGRRVKARSLEVQARLADLTQEVQEALTGIRLVKAYTMERVRSLAYRRACEEYLEKQVRLARLRGLFYGLLGLLSGCAFVIVLAWGGRKVATGELSLGGFVAFNSYLAMLSWPMMSVGFMVNLLQRARASMERIGQILDARPHIANPSDPKSLGRSTPCLSLEGVGFRYPCSDGWALRGISLSLTPGSWIGLTGPVASGKTTLLELIPRIHDPSEGRILLNGVDLRELDLEELRRKVALVSQEPFLFSESVACNVSFGSDQMDPAELEALARITRLDRDLPSLPQGWRTIVGERGIILSGGQRQRVALARALATRPQVLLLDDAFAHLDAETEAQILDALLKTTKGMTLIMVSHRLSTLMRTQWVVVLEAGKVAQQGPPQQLVEEPGYMRQIAHQQELLRELEALASKEPA